MALLFSAVTVTAGEDEVELLVGGIPREYDDLEGWSEFDDLMYFISEETEVSVRAEAYLYGEGESMRASPEEINDLMQRMKDDTGFLNRCCSNLESVNFTFIWSPEELFGMLGRIRLRAAQHQERDRFLRHHTLKLFCIFPCHSLFPPVHFGVFPPYYHNATTHRHIAITIPNEVWGAALCKGNKNAPSRPNGYGPVRVAAPGGISSLCRQRAQFGLQRCPQRRIVLIQGIFPIEVFQP